MWRLLRFVLLARCAHALVTGYINLSMNADNPAEYLDCRLSTNSAAWSARYFGNCFCPVVELNSDNTDIVYALPNGNFRIFFLDANARSSIGTTDIETSVTNNAEGSIQGSGGIGCGFGYALMGRADQLWALRLTSTATNFAPVYLTGAAAFHGCTGTCPIIFGDIFVCKRCSVGFAVALPRSQQWFAWYRLGSGSSVDVTPLGTFSPGIGGAWSWQTGRNYLRADGMQFAAYISTGVLYVWNFDPIGNSWSQNYARALNIGRPIVTMTGRLAMSSTPDQMVVSYSPVNGNTEAGYGFSTGITEGSSSNIAEFSAGGWYLTTKPNSGLFIFALVNDTPPGDQFSCFFSCWAGIGFTGTTYTAPTAHYLTTIHAHPSKPIFYYGSSWNCVGGGCATATYIDAQFNPPTIAPTASPTLAPTRVPTAVPTPVPTAVPTRVPTAQPTATPTTAAPTLFPTAFPTAVPTRTPTPVPTAVPTASPTAVPTAVPTRTPTAQPSAQPTASPTAVPSAVPTLSPTPVPTTVPTPGPTPLPGNPTAAPTLAPTPVPSTSPTPAPTAVPTTSPTPVPTANPTAAPTAVPTAQPTAVPTARPTAQPTPAPTPLPGLELPVACANTVRYGVAARIAPITCPWAQPCTGTENVTCAPTTQYMALSADGKQCGGFTRACRQSELSSLCPSSPTGSLSAQPVCSYQCNLDDFSSCGLKNLSCPVLALPVGLSKTCIDTCGNGTSFCSSGGAFVSTAQCTCADGAQQPTGKPCPQHGSVFRNCTEDESITYCGVDSVRGCRWQRFYVLESIKTQFEQYLNYADPATSITPSVLRTFFVNNNTDDAFIPSVRGSFTLDIPQCACWNTWKRPLPKWTQNTFSIDVNPAIYIGFNRLRWGTCVGGDIVTTNVQRYFNDQLPSTRAGTCNGVGNLRTGLPFDYTGSSCNENTWYATRRDNYNAGQQFLGGGLPPASFWWGASHVLQDVYTRNASVVGYPEATQFMSIFRNTNPELTIEGERYTLLRANPYDCEFDYLRRSPCGTDTYWTPEFLATKGGSVAPWYQRCLDPRTSPTIEWFTTRNVRHPVLQCLDNVGSYLCPNSTMGCVLVNITRSPQRVTSLGFCTPTNGGGALRMSSCVCPPYLTGYSCTVRNCSAGAECAIGFTGMNCTNGADCQLPTNFDPRAGCDHGTFDWFAGACICDVGWSVGNKTGSNRTCSVSACVNSTFRQTCESYGGTCSGSVCNNCPFNRAGVDCSQCRSAANVWWGGANCDVPTMYAPCVNGAVSVLPNGDVFCNCTEGWGGESCDVALCPVVNGLICAGVGTCSRPTVGSPYSCLQFAQSGSCTGYGCVSNPNVLFNGLPFMNASVGGCACQLDAARFCLEPGDTQLCNGRLDSSGCTVCRTRARADTFPPTQEMFCDCSVASGSTFTGQFCETDVCVNPTEGPGGTQCSGVGQCMPDGSCNCFNSTSDPQLPGRGRYCEIPVPACTRSQSGTNTICANSAGANPCVQLANSTYVCNCTNGRTPESKCTVLATPSPTPGPTRSPTVSPSAVPTPAPTTAAPTALPGLPTAAPTLAPSPSPTHTPTAQPSTAPTAAPTIGNYSLIDNNLCANGCFRGECRLNAADVNNPFCICPFPNVWAFDNITLGCERDACPTNSTPSANGTTCVCNDPTRVFENNTCRAARACPSASGTECGPAFPLAAGQGKSCSDGTCVCSGFYVLQNGTCAFRCSPTFTVGLNGTTCLCAPGFTSVSGCTLSSCPPPGIFFEGVCVTPSPTAGTRVFALFLIVHSTHANTHCSTQCDTHACPV